MGRDRRNEQRTEHFAKMVRRMMEEPAWRALSPTAQALYPWLKLEWKGPGNNNNGRIQLSVRQAAKAMGVTKDTACRAFKDLQRKGFLHVTRAARLGLDGQAKAPLFEITELPLPHGNARDGRKLYKGWKKSNDFPAANAMSNNPAGKNGKAETCLPKRDGVVIDLQTSRRSTS